MSKDDCHALPGQEARELFAHMIVQVGEVGQAVAKLDAKFERLAAAVASSPSVETTPRRGPPSKQSYMMAELKAATESMASTCRAIELSDVLKPAGISSRSHRNYLARSDEYRRVFNDFDDAQRRVIAEARQRISVSEDEFYFDHRDHFDTATPR